MGRSSSGTPPSDCTPMSFTLHGETDHVWEMDLIPETRYRVTVENLDTIHPVDQVRIVVRQQNLDNIAENTVSPRGTNTATTTFVSPSDGTVKVVVFSSSGELGVDLGQHTMKVCKIQ